LEKLEELNLSKNKLTNVSNVTKLTNLKTLDFSENEILKVPSDVNVIYGDDFIHSGIDWKIGTIGSFEFEK